MALYSGHHRNSDILAKMGADCRRHCANLNHVPFLAGKRVRTCCPGGEEEGLRVPRPSPAVLALKILGKKLAYITTKKSVNVN